MDRTEHFVRTWMQHVLDSFDGSFLALKHAAKVALRSGRNRPGAKGALHVSKVLGFTLLESQHIWS